ncbi:MAG: Sec1 family protein [Ignavibacteria bacterium]|nr:Sec1 family protein [Ignavibacteria bacterium]
MKQLFVLAIICLALQVTFSKNGAPALQFDQPVLVTSAGQSADVSLAGTLLKKMNVNHKVVNLAKENDLAGIKTLVIVPGFSSKGLGAAGISREQELERVKSIIKAAKEKNIKVVMVHLGGKARRGAQSDDLCQMAANASSYMLVVKQGDEDQLFSKIASQKKIPIKIIDRMADAVTPLKEVFGVK